MTDDWDPRAPEVRDDQIVAYDTLRERCRVAHSRAWGWSLLRHSDVVDALGDPVTFSNRVSEHVAIPNGMDPPNHTAYRAVVDRCFSTTRVAAFEPQLRDLTADLIERSVTGRDQVEVMSELALPFAARAQCAYLGWPETVADPLLRWSDRSALATAKRDRAELDRVAKEFDGIIRDVLTQTRAGRADGPSSVTVDLLTADIDGEALTDDQLVSMLRNWTVGELGTIAAAVGIICEFLARNADICGHLRTGIDQRALDEMLRLEAPLISNRRRTTRPATQNGVSIPSDTPSDTPSDIPSDAAVTIIWPAAQRDPRAFAEPDQFHLDRPTDLNLLYGRGIHYCPGEGLSRLELGVFTEVFLDWVPKFALRAPAKRAAPPSGGFAEVLLSLGEQAE